MYPAGPEPYHQELSSRQDPEHSSQSQASEDLKQQDRNTFASVAAVDQVRADVKHGAFQDFWGSKEKVESSKVCQRIEHRTFRGFVMYQGNV